MAVPVTYRYKWKGIDLVALQNQVNPATVVTPSNLDIVPCVDITLSLGASDKVGLDQAMDSQGWAYDSTNPPLKTAGIYQGSGSPEGALTASPGSMYMNTDGGSIVAVLWVKNTGVSNTGWMAVGLMTDEQTLTAGVGLLLFDMAYISAADTAGRASAADATKIAIGMVRSLSGGMATVRKDGEVTGLAGLVPGATYYLDVAEGGITNVPPSASGQIVQKIGVAVDATTILLQVDRDFTVL